MENLDLLHRGRALDIAMGNGKNAVFLAQNGFNVEGIDISEEAVKAASELAGQVGVSIDARVEDLESNFRMKESAYDVIICFHYLQRTLIPQIKRGIRKGGIVVYETFIVDQAQFGKPRNPDYLLQHNELLDMFREFRCLRYREGIFKGPRAVAGIVAQRV